MTVYSTTVGNTLTVFGPQPTNKFQSSAVASNAVSFGSGYFGDTGQDLAVILTKSVYGQVSLTNTVGKLAIKGLTNTIDVSNTVSKVFDKWQTNTIALTNTIDKRLDKYCLNTLTASDLYYRVTDHYIGNTLTVTAVVAHVNKYVGSYFIQFPGATSNLVSAVSSSYASQTVTSSTWTSGSVTSTSWS